MPQVLGVIPARWASTRFEGKVLADLDGKPMVQHVWERACKSTALSSVLIACDDKRVFEAAKKFGATVVMTSPKHASGTDRIIEAIGNRKCDIVVNVQGDEPLMEPKTVDGLVSVLVADPQAVMATVIKRITRGEDITDQNVVKVVIDHSGRALYFSRAVIPYNRDGRCDAVYYKHFGIYAYRTAFLKKYTKLPKSPLEETEKLEQLRALQAGYTIKTLCVETETIGVDTPADLARVAAVLAKAKRKAKG